MSTGSTQGPGCIRIQLENRPENVAVVRAALVGTAEAAGFDPELEGNLKTAVSEACNNIVLHAYGGQRGPIAVDVNWDADRVDVVVADRGTGIQRVSGGAEHMGLGLALISALSDQAEFRSPQNGGTEVRMRFRRGPEASEAGIARDGVWHAGLPGLKGDVLLWCQPVTLLRHVLGRVARAVAARSHFTVTGARALYAINDVMANYAESAAGANVVVAITGTSRRLALDGGPFTYDLDGSQIAELVDEISFEQSDGQGLLHLVVSDSGREAAA